MFFFQTLNKKRQASALDLSGVTMVTIYLCPTRSANPLMMNHQSLNHVMLYAPLNTSLTNHE